MRYQGFKYRFTTDYELPEGRRTIVYVYRIKPSPKLLVGWFCSSIGEGEYKARKWIDNHGDAHR